MKNYILKVATGDGLTIGRKHGADMVHTWCIHGAYMVHTWCIHGADISLIISTFKESPSGCLSVYKIQKLKNKINFLKYKESHTESCDRRRIAFEDIHI